MWFNLRKLGQKPLVFLDMRYVGLIFNFFWSLENQKEMGRSYSARKYHKFDIRMKNTIQANF